jgi:type I site-specific restriction-modification system R (restriction) subunit
LNFFTNHLGYPATNIQIERAFKVNKLVRRTDIQVFNSLGELLIIIECKAPHIEINDITFQQISQYQQKNVAKYLALTNGLENHIFEINATENQTNKINQFPAYL